MIGHLLRDAVRRYRSMYFVVGAFLALTWMIAGIFSSTAALAFSLAGAWFLGVYSGVPLFSTRELGLLPIQRRTVWRAQWLTSTVVATSWTTAAKLVGVAVVALFGRAPDLPFMALSSCLDFLYNGVLLAVIAVTGISAGRPWGASMVRRSVQTLGGLVALIGGAWWGFVLRPIMPTNWAQVTGTTALVMGAALVVCIAAFFYPQPAGKPRFDLARRQIRRRRDGLRSLRPGRLVGLSKLIADDLVSTAWTAALLPAMLAAIFFGVYVFNPAPGVSPPPDVLKEMGMLPLRHEALFRHCFVLLLPAFSLINNRRLSGADPVSPFMRQLRVLPVSARQLNGLIVGRRLLGWAVVWLSLLVFHVIVFRSAPTTLRLDILLWLAGADALVYALLLCWMRWWPTFTFIIVFGIVSGNAIDRLGGSYAPLVGMTIGLTCLAAAVWINRVTLSWRQEPYRPVPEPGFAKWYAVR